MLEFVDSWVFKFVDSEFLLKNDFFHQNIKILYCILVLFRKPHCFMVDLKFEDYLRDKNKNYFK